MSGDRRTPFGLILLLYGAGFGAAAQLAQVASTFEELRVVYPAGEITQGLLLSMMSVVGVLFGVIAGQIVAINGYKFALTIGLAVGAAMSFVQATLPSLEMFLATRFIEGASHLIIVVAAPTLMAQLSADRHRYISMTLWSTFVGVGFAVFAVLAPIFVPAFGLKWFFAAHGVYMAVFAGLVWRLLDNDETKGGALPSLGAIWRQHVTTYRSPSESPAAWGWLFYTLTYVAVLTVLPPYLPEGQRVFLAAFLPISGILSSISIGAVLLRHLPAVSVVQIGFALGTLASVWLAVMGVSGTALVVLFASLGLVQPASFALIPELNPSASAQAHANGAMAQMGNLGNAIGTPLLLVLVAAAGPSSFPIALVILYALALFAHAYTKRLRDRAA